MVSLALIIVNWSLKEQNNARHDITGMGKKISVLDTDGDIISVYNLLGPVKKAATSAT